MTVRLMKQKDVCTDHIWAADGSLVPMPAVPIGCEPRDLAIVTISRDRPDLVDRQVDELRERCKGISTDVYVIEMGSSRTSRHQTFWYDDPDYRGKPYGHNVGVRIARATADYRYYYVAMNDVFCLGSQDAPGELVKIMDAHPRLGLLAPTCKTAGYLDAKPRGADDHHLVTSADYLIQMVRADTVVHGFFNPDFKYCWNVELEHAYLLNKAGYELAYCDTVQRVHYGTSTWGQVPGLPSKRVYKQRAKAFAIPYLIDKYGYEWDEKFSEVLPIGVRFNRHKLLRQHLQGLGGDKPKPIRLHLGCDDRYRYGFINIDSEKRGRTDAVYGLSSIPHVPSDSIAEIVSYKAMLRLWPGKVEHAILGWHRMLAPGAPIKIDRCGARLDTLRRAMRLARFEEIEYNGDTIRAVKSGGAA